MYPGAISFADVVTSRCLFYNASACLPMQRSRKFIVREQTEGELPNQFRCSCEAIKLKDSICTWLAGRYWVMTVIWK
jgi:hypothetical protein